MNKNIHQIIISFISGVGDGKKRKEHGISLIKLFFLAQRDIISAMNIKDYIPFC